MEKVVVENVCIWTPDEDGIYATSCGQAFMFIDSGPKENRMKFCCYCGKPLKEEHYEQTKENNFRE